MGSFTSVGKQRRLQHLLHRESGRVVIVPIDDGLISLSRGLRNLDVKLKQLASAAPDAILGFPGIFVHYQNLLRDIPLIVNLTASTVHSDHTHKILIGNVSQALALAADAVAAHVNISSKYEPQMLKTLGKVVSQCETYGMPVIAIMYPRSEAALGDNNYLDLRQRDRSKYADLVAHAARVGVELGASIVKTQYTGSAESFSRVVEACGPVPVVVAGGPLSDPQSILQVAHDAVSVGGSGISFGRNVFERSDTRLLGALKALVHDMEALESVMQKYFPDELSSEAKHANTTGK